MTTTSVRLDGATYAAVGRLAAETGQPMSAVLRAAVECYRRQRLHSEAETAYAALRASPEDWAEEAAERRLWDATLRDGIDDD